ncbi:hypothetical protein [Sulfuricurvum sp.]|uniref:hypothetical protein n=1 Tax=Sulfuricurvum sp. TaxID=2025608 RepID=UPI00356301A4
MSRISVDDFLVGLRINIDYFLKVLKNNGLDSRYFLTKTDLEFIRDFFPASSYKSAQVVNRAQELLERLS